MAGTTPAPVQVAKTEKGREKLTALLDYYDRMQEGESGTLPRIDINRLRRMLGLPPK